MRRPRSISLLAAAFAVVPLFALAPEVSGQSDDQRDDHRVERYSGYSLRHRVSGLRYSSDYYSRPRQSRLSFSRERSLGQRGDLSLYPGPPDSPHRGRLRNDYAAYPNHSRSRWHRTAPIETPRYEELPGDGVDAPSIGGPRYVIPPNIIIDPAPPRDPRRELPMADAERETGWTLLARGETVRALGRFAGRIAVSGSDAEARAGYAIAAALYGDDGAAQTSMKIALDLDPSVLRAVEIDEALATRLAELTERFAESHGEAFVMCDALGELIGDDDRPVLAAK